ncbi:DUF2841 domain-containing protein [Aspergillus stella-maris]|uniref:DUF2841 domain-containing protein n=1 Tax=Aspergillus stella-maris TaxID=1810926 RepID=UPI003CCD2256
MSAAAPVEGPLDSLASHHFALLYIDETGKLRFEASPSIANDCHSILSSDVTQSFLKAVALSGDGTRPANSFEYTYNFRNRRSPLSSEPRTPSYSRRSSISELADGSKKRKRESHEHVLPMNITCYPKSMLPIANKALLRKYYEKAFDSLHQTNCRILAKAYVKLVEPRKQVSYPYNGHKNIAGVPHKLDPEDTKPPWWPEGVIHREPDHLKKPDRIRLLVHILCELRGSHAIDVEKLKEADQSIRRQIAPVERLQVLDEIYRVRGEEERYLDGGGTDTQAVVYVSRVHLPDVADSQASTFSPAASFSQSNNSYRQDIPDLEAHTSVFPTNLSTVGSTMTRQGAEVSPHSAQSVVMPSVPTTSPWDACHLPVPVSSALPPLSSTMKHPSIDSSAAPYTLNYLTSMYQHHDSAPTSTFDMQPFAMNSYSQQQMAPSHSHSHLPQHTAYMNEPHPGTSVPIHSMGSSASTSGYGQPYYFGY